MACDPNEPGKIYIGDTPLITLNTCIALAGASTLEIEWEAPSGATGNETASIYDSTYAQFQIPNTSFLNEVGQWKFIVHVIAPTVAPNWQGYGEPHKEYVYEKFSDQITT
jgi:hypothetical protein